MFNERNRIIQTVAFAILGLLATPSSCQRTWLVDTLRGVGSDFSDVQPAIDAASAGDLVLVRTGISHFYTGFTIRKGVSVMCEQRGGGYRVTSNVVIRDVPSGARVSLSGYVGFDASSLILENNLGSVSIEKCQTGSQAAQIFIRASREVVLNEVTTLGVQISSSFVTVNRGINGSGFAAAPLLPAHDSVVVLGNSVLVVTLGHYDFQRCAVIYRPGDAISGSNSVLVLGAGTELRAGRLSGSIPPCPPVFVEGYSVRGRNVHVLKDPAATMTPVGPGVTVTTAAFPTLDGIVGDEVNGRMDFDTIGAPGSATVLLASPPASPLLTPMGFQWIDFGAYLVADVAILDPTGHRRVSFPFPALYPLGRAMHFQSVVLDPSGLRWSTPSAIVRN